MFTTGSGYEHFMGRWSRLLAPGFIAFAGTRDGDRVLDVGCGTGALAGALAGAFPTSVVVGVDPSSPFVAHARAGSGSDRVRFEVGDVQALGFGDASFDHTMALLVLNFVPDPAGAVREMCRVTRPGGTLSACVWDYGEGMQMLRLFWDEAVALDPAAAPRDERRMKLARRGELGELWQATGLVEVQESSLVVETGFASFDDYWAPFLEGVGPAGAHVASLPEHDRQALEARLRTLVPGPLGAGSFALSARAWCVRGTVPGK